MSQNPWVWSCFVLFLSAWLSKLGVLSGFDSSKMLCIIIPFMIFYEILYNYFIDSPESCGSKEFWALFWSWYSNCIIYLEVGLKLVYHLLVYGTEYFFYLLQTECIQRWRVWCDLETTCYFSCLKGWKMIFFSPIQIGCLKNYVCSICFNLPSFSYCSILPDSSPTKIL